MKKGMKVAIIVTAAIAVLALAGYLLITLRANAIKADYAAKQLTSFTESSGGGMNGGRTLTRVELSEDKTNAVIFTGSSNWYYLDMRTEAYITDKALLDEIAAIVAEDKIYAAKISDKSEFIVYDAPTTSFAFDYEDGERIYLSNSQTVKPSFWDSQKKIDALIEEYKAKAKQYPTVYALSDEEFVDWKKENDISLHVISDMPFALTLEVHNELDANKSLSGPVTLSLVKDGQSVQTRILQENLSFTEIWSGGMESATINFQPDEFPEEGTYLLEYAGYETTFEVRIYDPEQ